MKHGKKGLIMGIAVLAVIALVFGGYHIFRYPALFRNLSDRSLDETQTEELPEEIQREGTAEFPELENLPACTYRQQEIELENQGQKIYGIACIPETENETVPLVICAHGLGGSYQSNAAYAEQLASHGSADRIVPLSYSDRAAEVYEDAEYHVIDGAGHGFHGDAFEEAVRYVFAYLQEIRII